MVARCSRVLGARVLGIASIVRLQSTFKPYQLSSTNTSQKKEQQQIQNLADHCHFVTQQEIQVVILSSQRTGVCGAIVVL